MGGKGSKGMKRDEETVCWDFKGEEGAREGDGEREERRISDGEARSAVCLRAFQPGAAEREREGEREGFEWSNQFLS